MEHYQCDYACGAAPCVLEALVSTNDAQTVGYAEDEYCEQARDLIRYLCEAPEAGVHFAVGGTQANLLVISAALRSYEGALCADSGHINVHETGAIEATGHKVLPLPAENGKINARQVREAYHAHWEDPSHEHMVKPRIVYISHPTELGTLYTRQELTDMYKTCRELGLLLYVDGARLGYGLAAMPDVDLPFLAAHTDAFTIGGTKVGLLFGEAIVISNRTLNCEFRYHIKQRGAMLAKGRLLGIQYLAILKENAYVTLSAHANGLAKRIQDCFTSHGCTLLADTGTNQIFPIVPNSVLERLASKYRWSGWCVTDEAHTAVRFCTNVTTTDAQVDALLSDVDAAFASEEA